jgi:hypothetical protein
MEATMPTDKKPTFDTSQRIFHVFGCTGPFMHLVPGFAVLQTNSSHCPYCGADVQDVTNTPVGKAYFAQTRPDLGAQQP